MSKSHPTIRKLADPRAVNTGWGTCSSCGRRGLLRTDTKTCAEAARIPACERRAARAVARATAALAVLKDQESGAPIAD